MSENLKTCMSYADLLKWTETNGKDNFIDVLALPKDPTLQPRYLLAVSGPDAVDIINMMVDALDEAFTRVTEDGSPASPEISH